jgi:hypothetical protein
MAYCRQNGVTKVIDMVNAKGISEHNDISFNQVVQTKKKSADWDETEAKLFNRSYEEVKQNNAALREAR